MFSTPESLSISEKFTAVRLTGGNDLDDEGKAFMKRYGVGGYPTLLAMTADGAVLHRLVPSDRSTKRILAIMDAAATTEADFKAKFAELSAKTDADSVRTLARLYMARAQFDEARTRFEKLTATNPTVEDQSALLEILESAGDRDGRKALLETLVKTRATSDKHIKWRMDLALFDLATEITSREQWLDVMAKKKTALGALLLETEKTADQAVVRNELANTLARTGDVETAMEHWDWILEKARDSDAGAEALMVTANNHFRNGREDVEELKAGRALLKEVVDKHPNHAAAQQAAKWLPDVDRAIDELTKKAAEEAAGEGEGEGEDDGEGK